VARTLEDKVIVITGASSGIGAATAIACAEAGMNVVVAARREEELRQVAARVEQMGVGALPVVCDVRQDDDVQRLIDTTIDTFGRLDVLFANAGYGIFGSVMDTSDRQVRDIFETNFFGTVRCIHAAVPAIRRTSEQGHVVICSSAASEISVPMYGFYAATKAAQDSIGGAMRAELYSQGIYVTTVHPIGTRTAFFDIVKQKSVNAGSGLNTPTAMTHSSERVADAIVRCLRRPKPEVWPSVATRFAVALVTAVPSIGAWALRRILRRRMRRKRRSARGGDS